MKALNAAGVTPISILPPRKTEPRGVSSLPSSSPLRPTNSSGFKSIPPVLTQGLSRGFHGGLVLLSSVLGGGFSGALTYEEALQQSAGASDSKDISDFDIGGFLDGVVSFGVENPAIIAGVAVVLAVPVVISQVLKSPKPWGVESAKSTFAKMGNDVDSQLLDIRSPSEFRQVGSPDVGALKKKPVSVFYRGEDKPGFLKKLALKFKEPEKTTLFILDKFDGNSELVAELVTANGFKAAYAIKDGAEGPQGWLNSGLPWVTRKRTLSFDFGNFSDAISDILGETSEALPVTIGIAAAAGLGLLTFTEVETILQVLGSAALVQFVSKKLLFAEDRKETLQQFDEFLNTKIGPKEFVGEIQEIGKALLPPLVNKKTLPAPAESVRESNGSSSSKPIPEINSVPKAEIKVESHSGLSKALSPYPHYPDLRPPTSPTPSQP